MDACKLAAPDPTDNMSLALGLAGSSLQTTVRPGVGRVVPDLQLYRASSVCLNCSI
jgi:hypothetical protein